MNVGWIFCLRFNEGFVVELGFHMKMSKIGLEILETKLEINK